MWLPFALITALITGGRRIYDKHLTNTFGNFAMGFIVQAFALLPGLILIFVLPEGTEFGTLPWRFWWPLLIIWFLLYPIQTYLMYRSVREGDISEVTPVMCLLPVFNIATSFFLLGEVPTSLGYVGIFLITIGTYFALRTENGNNKFSTPVLLMIGAMLCIALGTSLDKISVEASNPVFYGFVNTLGASIVFVILMYFYKEKHYFNEIFSRRWFWPLMLLGVFQAISYVATMYAFKYGPVSYVLAIRSGSFVLAVIYGILVLKERFSMRKAVSFTFFIGGVIALSMA